ncbi:peptidase M36, partial [Chytriomyces sp. MP71]
LVKRATTAIYNVIPIGQRNPEQNNGLTAVKNPADSTASPDGWHVLKGKPQTDLKGNNVIAQSNPDNVMDIDQLVQLTRPQNADLNFNFQFDPAQSPTDSANRDAATVNMFYVANSMHDILFNYGFDEAAGNFQDSNASGQGQGNDPVIANSQDGSGTNNANFASGPDGMAGLMRMYVFTQSSPSRDGALENDIVSHEITHGLSTRLTGGAANANCLTTTESGGLGEGWSDTFGMLVSLSATATRTTDFASGFWAVNNPNGVRRFPYSTNMQTNPHTYGDLDQMQEVHQIGEVWATMLFEAMWNLVDAYGLTPPPQLAASAKSGTGNTVLMALLIAGMKIQPCNPTFVQARDAILVADKTIQGGKDACLLWTAFAKRGLG